MKEAGMSDMEIKNCEKLVEAQKYKLGPVLYSSEEIAHRVCELAEEIKRDYGRGEKIMMVGILKGSVFFMADLARAIGEYLDLRIDFMSVSSYGSGANTSGVVKIIKDTDVNIEGRHVIITEDIIDTGLTLTYLKNVLLNRNPKSLKLCTLLNKPERRERDAENLKIDYLGFSIPNKFVVGYGLDVAGMWRHLADIRIVE